MFFKNRFLFLSSCFLLFASCEKDHSTITNVLVDFSIDLSLPSYSTLNAVGNYIYVTGGVKGIIVYHSSIDTYMAYDRACSYDPNATNALVVVDSSGIELIDRNCNSKFNILNGTVTHSPATTGLKVYAADFDGVQTVHVHN